MIGSIAAVLTTGAFLPQAIKTIRTRETSSLSMPMTLMRIFGMALWLIYGIQTSNPALCAANSVSLILNMLILSVMLQVRNSQKAAAECNCCS